MSGTSATQIAQIQFRRGSESEIAAVFASLTLEDAEPLVASDTGRLWLAGSSNGAPFKVEVLTTEPHYTASAIGTRRSAFSREADFHALTRYPTIETAPVAASESLVDVAIASGAGDLSGPVVLSDTASGAATVHYVVRRGATSLRTGTLRVVYHGTAGVGPLVTDEAVNHFAVSSPEPSVAHGWITFGARVNVDRLVLQARLSSVTPIYGSGPITLLLRVERPIAIV